MLRRICTYFNRFERGLWLTSVLVITLSFLISGQFEPLYCFTTLLGVTALVFLAKGNVVGQMMIVVFSLLYGYISYNFAYYGEMFTYLGMTGPMAFLAAVQWYLHPFEEGKNEVEIARLSKKQLGILLLATAAVTTLFYFILAHFNTSYLPLSTLSVATSFFAMGLTYLRSPWYAVAYASNDLVLVGLWILASMQDISYLSMVVCFSLFFVNDLYGYYNWTKMKAAQAESVAQQPTTPTPTEQPR